jgi:hypothetical protein
MLYPLDIQLSYAFAGTPVLLPRSAGFQDSRYCHRPLSSLTQLAPGHADTAGPSVRHSSRWTLSYCFAHPDPKFIIALLDPRLW